MLCSRFVVRRTVLTVGSRWDLVSRLSSNLGANNTVESANNKSANGLKPTIIKVVPKKRIDYDIDYTANNYLTPLRALYEYLLQPEDLEPLKQYTRRSPYEQGTNPIKVYLRADVEEIAIRVWGSKEALKQERKRRRVTVFQENLAYLKLKKALRDYKKKQALLDSLPHHQSVPVLKRFSRVVLIAASVNAMNVVVKAAAFVFTGSASIFSEMIHSVADTINQFILAYGQYKSLERPDHHHPYGYTNMTYITSLISGVGIFCFGTGLAWYHGITCLMNASQPGSLYTGLALLSLSLFSESGTLYFAIRENNRNAKLMNMSFLDYIKLGYNPSVNVVLLEDTAAVCGVGVAGLSMAVSHFLDSPIPDAMGSLVIGGILAYIAYFIISTNTLALTNRSIHPSQLQAIQNDLENDVCIRALFDVKATDMGAQSVMFKAEVDLDGAAITRSYLDKIDAESLLQELRECQTNDELEAFLIRHGERVVDRVGEEIDRIEKKIKKKYPSLRHVDLEVL